MAAIDPNEDTGNAPPRATLKIIHNVLDYMEDSEDEDEELDLDDVEEIERRLGLTSADSDEEDEDEDEDDDEDMLDEGDEDDEMVNGGPSDPEKRRNARGNALLKALQGGVLNDMGEDDDDEKPNGLLKLDKGKGRAVEDQEDDDDISGGGMEEYVVCTLDRNMVCLSSVPNRGFLLTIISSPTNNHSTSPSDKMRKSISVCLERKLSILLEILLFLRKKLMMTMKMTIPMRTSEILFAV
jgi:hypothetical protein